MLITKKIYLSNYTPSANFDDGKRDGLFLSKGERPNPFPEHKLVNGGVAENIIEVPNPGSDDTIHGNLGMVEKTDVVEEVHHDTGVRAVGKNVHSEFVMDEGNAKEDDEPTIAAEKGNVMRKRIDFTNSTPSSNFCDGEGEELLLLNGVRPKSFP